MKRLIPIIAAVGLLVAACTQTGEATRNPKPPCHPCKYPTTTMYVL